MNEGLFRKKSMDKISSPEQLDDYIKVSNPGVWMILSAIIILLVGMCVWGIFGELNTTVTVSAISINGTTICYVGEEIWADVEDGMVVVIDDREYSVKEVATVPIKVNDEFDEYALHIGNLQVGEWVYEVVVEADLDDGIYEAEIVTESIAPISFLLE